MALTDQQFMAESLASEVVLAQKKFKVGVKKYGGKLWTKKGLLKQRRLERVDDLFYDYAMTHQIWQAIDLLKGPSISNTIKAQKILLDIVDEPDE